MKTNRLEAFSDGVLAIIITIMVLEMKVPRGTDWNAFSKLAPVFATYVMSFIYLGIYWNNHHHLMHLTERINGWVLWANLHLLFWLSLIPFVTGWVGANQFAALPTALYGGVLLLSSFAWLLLQKAILWNQTENDNLRNAIGSDAKGKMSFGLYVVGIAIAFYLPWAAIALYILVALLWLIPDKRIEAQFRK